MDDRDKIIKLKARVKKLLELLDSKEDQIGEVMLERHNTVFKLKEDIQTQHHYIKLLIETYG